VPDDPDGRPMTASPSAVSTDLAIGLERCFLFDAIEDSYQIPEYSGRVPKWLRGSWYINGPARFERAGQRYNHWLDGDGMVCALLFEGEQLRFTNRFVRTPKWITEQAAGRFLYRGFGTTFAGDLLRHNLMLEPPVNVSVFRYGAHLLAFGEQTLPYELDPVTLETLGEFDFGGTLNRLSPFAAHAALDRGLMNFGVSFSTTKPMLSVYEFDESGALSRKRYRLDHQYSIHDFGFTLHHMVFFLSPLLMKFERFRNDGVSILEALRWEPELGSRILVSPRKGCADEAFTIEAGGGYCLHLINCFETAAHLIVDVLLLDAPIYSEYRPVPDLFATVPRCRPVRYIIDLETHELSVCSMEYTHAPDFPSVDPALAGRPYSDFWMLGIPDQGKPGRKFFSQLAHGSWERGDVFDIYQARRGEYLCGEPSFVSNPRNPSEAIVICEHFQPAENATSIVLFDAFHVNGGPIASLPLRHTIHPGFHSTFVPSAEGAR
jgi:all-trans-8'-apo-beta-carotenal 15,15'-oxygenase